MKSFITTILVILISYCGYCQCASDQTLYPDLSVKYRRAGSAITFNPTNQVYYGVRNEYLMTYHPNGQIKHYFYFPGIIGLWWNPNLNQLEGNHNGAYGIVKINLDPIENYVTSVVSVLPGSHMQPNSKSAATYDPQTDEILFFEVPKIYKFSRTTGLATDTVNAHLMGNGVHEFTSDQLAIRDCPGGEILIYNRYDKEIYFINKMTGAFHHKSSMFGASGALIYNGFSLANNKIYVNDFDYENKWEGYDFTDELNLYTLLDSSFCSGDSMSIGVYAPSTFDSTNQFTLQLSDENGSFNSPITLDSNNQTPNSVFNFHLPTSLPPSHNYVLRAVSSSPAFISAPSKFKLTINIPPSGLPDSITHCIGSPSYLSVEEHKNLSYNWSNGSTNHSISITPTVSSWYYVTVTNSTCQMVDSVYVQCVTPATANMPDTLFSCNATLEITANPSTAYFWSNGKNTPSITVNRKGYYHVTMTDTNGCPVTHSTYANLFKPEIAIPDTTICLGDTITLFPKNASGIGNFNYFKTNDYSTNFFRPGYESVGGIAVTPNYVYAQSYNHTIRYTPDLLQYELFPIHEGLFSNLADGQLFSLWNTVENAFTSDLSDQITAIQRFNEHLQPVGSPMLLSDTINAGVGSHVFLGYDMLIIHCDADDHFYVIDLGTGEVTDLGYRLLWALDGESWASYGNASRDNLGNYYVYYTSSLNSVLVKLNVQTGGVELLLTTNDQFGESHSLTLSPFNNKWYFINQTHSFAAGKAHSIAYADAYFEGIDLDTNNVYSWSNGVNSMNNPISPTSTTTYILTKTSGSLSCSDTVQISVSGYPVINMLDSVNMCNTDTAEITTISSHHEYLWSNGKTDPVGKFTATGWKYLQATNSVGCAAQDSIYLNLLDSRIFPVDTSHCSADSLRLEIGNGCGHHIDSILFDDLYDVSGQNAATIEFFTVNEKYAYFQSTLTTYRLHLNNNTLETFSTEGALITDPYTGQLYELRSSSHPYNFNPGAIVSFRKVDASLNPMSPFINFSQTLSTSGNGSIIAPGNGFFILCNNSQTFHVSLETGFVTSIPNTGVTNVFHKGSGWAAVGFSECENETYSVIGRKQEVYNHPYDDHYIIKKTFIANNNLPPTVVGHRSQGLGNLSFICFSPWREKWYGVNTFGSDNLGRYLLSLISGDVKGNLGQANGAQVTYWNTMDSTHAITVFPDTNTTYISTAQYLGHTCVDSVNITITPSPTSTSISDTLTCFSDTNGTISIMANTGIPPYSYLWSTNDTTPVVNHLSPGVYYCTITGQNNCTTIDTVSVESPSELKAYTLQHATANCYNETNGIAEAVVYGGVPPYSYQWENGTLTAIDSNLARGPYHVSITDSAGCGLTHSVYVSSHDSIYAPGTISANTNSFCDGDTVTLNVEYPGVYGTTFTYRDTSTHIFPTAIGAYDITFANTPQLAQGAPVLKIFVKGDFSGTHNSIYVGTESVAMGNYGPINSTNCEFTEITYLVNPGIFNSWLSDDTLHFNISANSHFSNTCPTEIFAVIEYNYTQQVQTYWFDTIPTDVSNALGTGGAIDLIFDSNKDYYAVNVGAVCQSEISHFSPQHPIANLLTISQSPSIICINDSATFTASGANHYIWPSVFSPTSQNNQVYSTQVTNSHYVITFTDTAGCMFSDSLHVNLFPQPNILISQITPQSCASNADGGAVLSGSNGVAPYQFEWNNGFIGHTQSLLSSNTYTVTITDSNQCSNTLDVVIPSLPVITAQGQITHVSCAGLSDGAIQLITQGGGSSYQFHWSNNDTASGIFNLSPGGYSVTITDANNCSLDTLFTINEPDSLINSAVITHANCNHTNTGEISIASSGGTAPYSYNWSHGATGHLIQNMAGGTYIVTITDQHGCVDTISETIAQPSTPYIITNALIQNNSCPNDSLGSIQIAASGGTGPLTYNWSNNTVNAQITNLFGGIYHLSVTDSLGCQIDTSFSVSSPNHIITSASQLDHVDCYNGNNGLIVVQSTGGTPPYQYQWSTGQNTSSINNLISGLYIVTSTDGNLCTVVDTFEVLQPTELSISANASHLLCFNDSNATIQTNVSGGTMPFQYAWNTASSMPHISGLSVGTYTLTVTDANNCTDTLSQIINQPSALTVSIDTFQHVHCAGGANGAITSTISGGTTPYAMLWSSGQTTSSITNLTAGNYSIQVSDSNGCVTTSAISLMELSSLVIDSIQTSDVLCHGDSSGAIHLNINGNAGSVSYLWNSGSTNSHLVGVPQGQYTVTATDSLGCMDSTTILVHQPNAITASFSHTLPTCNNASNGTITATITGGTGGLSHVWNTGDTSLSIASLTAGMYTITTTDDNNCISVFSEVLTNPAVLHHAFNSNAPICYYDTNGNLSSQVSGGIGPYNYIWNTGDTLVSIHQLGTGMYSITVTDSLNCTISDTISLQASQPRLFSQLPLDTTACADSMALQVPPIYASYQWSTNSQTNSSGPITFSQTVQFIGKDTANCEYIDTVNTILLPIPMVNLGADTIICSNQWNNQLLNLDAGSGHATYLWNSGATTQTDSALTSGTYTVTVTNTDGCSNSDTILVTYDPCANIEELDEMGHITLYPNPSNGIINVALNGHFEHPIEIFVVTTNGKLIVQKKIQTFQSQTYHDIIDISHVAKGMYFMKIKSGNTEKIEKILII